MAASMRLMIGTMNFDVRFLLWVSALVGMAGAGMTRADVVTLTSGAQRLTGVLKSIDGEGTMELQSDLSREPLRVRGAMVENVKFAVTEAEADLPSVKLELVNGDVIPCEIVEINTEALMVDSSALGKLRIERRHVATMKLAARGKHLVYKGPIDDNDWKRANDGQAGWKFNNGDLVAQGQAHSQREIGFPERFDLKFELGWEKNKVPSFQLFFCDPLVAAGERCDRYYLQYGSAGMELKRESYKDRRYTTIASVNQWPRNRVIKGWMDAEMMAFDWGDQNRTSQNTSDQKLLVELQVDRRSSTFRLMLNGKLQGEFRDPVGSAPKGAGMAIVSQAADGVTQTLRGIEIVEGEAPLVSAHDERLVTEDRDSLITRQNERWTGELLGMSVEDKGHVLRFKSDFGERLIKLPEADASAVYFGQKREAESLPDKIMYLMRQADGGVLRVASCRFAEDVATVDHPLLGVLNLGRGQLRSIEKVTSNKAKSMTE
jgi:hypothetical protein